MSKSKEILINISCYFQLFIENIRINYYNGIGNVNDMNKTRKDGVLVKRRFDSHLYKIDVLDYEHIIEMIENYQESIYDLPEDEMVEVVGVDKEVRGAHEIVPVNNLIFC